MKDNPKRILSFTGGATKFIQLVIACTKILKHGYNPTDIIVKSSSAIKILLILLGKGDIALKEGSNLDLSKYFDVIPTDGNGKLTFKAKLRAIWSFMPSWMGGNVNSFGVQDVRPLIKKYLTNDDFLKYKLGDYPNVWTVSVKPSYGSLKEYIHVQNLKECKNLNEALLYIEGSSQIQTLTEGVKINNDIHFDGGMYLAGSAGYLLQEKIFDNVEEVVSVYSWTDPHFDILDSKDWKNDIGSNMARMSQFFKGSNKYFCRSHEELYCKVNNIKRTEFMLPDVFKNTYEYSKETVNQAILETNKYMDNKLESLEF